MLCLVCSWISMMSDCFSIECLPVAGDENRVLDEKVQSSIFRLPLLHCPSKQLLLLLGRLVCELPCHRLPSWKLLVFPQIVQPVASTASAWHGTHADALACGEGLRKTHAPAPSEVACGCT